MTIPSRSIRTFLLLAVLGAGPLFAQDWKGVEGIMGMAGLEDQAGIRFYFPRTDLNVLVQGVPLDPMGMLVSEVVLTPEGKGARLQARCLLLEGELAKALSQAARNGLRVNGLDDPFPGASPNIRCLRLEGTGSRKSLAWAVKMVLNSTGTPFVLIPPVPQAPPKKDPWAEVRQVFGPGFETGKNLLYEWDPRPEGADASEGKLRVVLQLEGHDMALWGELSSPLPVSEPWPPLFLTKNFRISATTHGFEEKPMGWVDFWYLNDEKKEINILTTLLEEAGFSPSTDVP